MNLDTKKYFHKIGYLCLCLLCTGCWNNKYTITGDIAGELNDRQWVYLYTGQGNKFVCTDSTLSKEGDFRFSGELSTPEMALISCQEMSVLGYKPALFVLEPGKIEVRLDTLSTAQGTNLNQKWENYQNSRRWYDMTITRLSNEYLKRVNNYGMNDSVFTYMQDQFVTIEEQIKKLTENYIRFNYNNVTSVFVLIENSYLFTDQEIFQLLEKGTEKFRTNPNIISFYQSIERRKKIEEGSLFPTMTLQTLDGSQVSLDSFIQSGQWLYLYFWTSWCIPCLKEFPYIEHLYQQYNDQGLNIVGISLDNNRRMWTESIKRFHLQGTQLSDLKGWESKSITLYGIPGVPFSLLINDKGIIVGYDLPPQQVSKMFSNYLKQQKNTARQYEN